jgi:hypothetical protein
VAIFCAFLSTKVSYDFLKDFLVGQLLICALTIAFGFTQFNQLLPSTENIGTHNLVVSHLQPFGCRLDIEVIKTPKPLKSDRTYGSGGETIYIHFILNQRTLPLGLSFLECGADRLDGWCELGTFLDVQKKSTELADYDFACNADYPAVPYGDIKNGAPNK